MPRQYYVYIMTNQHNRVHYTGVTNDLVRRVWQHRHNQGAEFTAKYRCSKLVFYEIYQDSYNAIAREKQIKAGSRNNKIKLVTGINPKWLDLYDRL